MQGSEFGASPKPDERAEPEKFRLTTEESVTLSYLLLDFLDPTTEQGRKDKIQRDIADMGINEASLKQLRSSTPNNRPPMKDIREKFIEEIGETRKRQGEIK